MQNAYSWLNEQVRIHDQRQILISIIDESATIGQMMLKNALRITTKECKSPSSNNEVGGLTLQFT